MARININYLNLKAGYLFPEISKRVRVFQKNNPKAKIIKLGIGDVTLPLPKQVVRAMKKAVQDMGTSKGFRGYGPEQGYLFLRELISKHDFGSRGVSIDPEEIFVSDGSKCDTGNITDIFGIQNRVAVTDPAYPVYVDTNIMDGRSLEYLPMVSDNNFEPPLPKKKADLIYICSPNNPTGIPATRAALKKWVKYAREHQSIIFFDAAYEGFIRNPAIPHSIFEIPGARQVAIEFRSFSKAAGFTGTRCAYTVVPKQLMGQGRGRQKISIHGLWMRRQTTKFNGVSYPIQAGAASIYSVKGRRETKKLTDYYMMNAKIIRKYMKALGLEVYGGTDAPYIWIRAPYNMSSWEFFDLLLSEAHVVGTPGSGFGPSGEGYLRLSAFGSRKDVENAMPRIKKVIG